MGRVKLCILGAGLAILTVWPLVHICLVKYYELNPWKLAGWGMYSAPRSRSLGMEIFGRAASADALGQLTNPSQTARDEATRYLERHRWLRLLVRPDGLAAAALESRPTWREIKIVVFEPDLVRETGMMIMKMTVHRYSRVDEAGGAAAGPQGVRYLGVEAPERADLPSELLNRWKLK